MVACGFCQEAPTFHDPERAGLERHDFHAVLQPLPARLPNNTCDHHVSQVASQPLHTISTLKFQPLVDEWMDFFFFFFL